MARNKGGSTSTSSTSSTTSTTTTGGAEHDTPKRTKPFKGTNVEIADPSLHDVRAHHEAYQPKTGGEAFTAGRDVFFNDGHYTPGNGGGSLMGHEAKHVAQQGASR